MMLLIVGVILYIIGFALGDTLLQNIALAPLTLGIFKLILDGSSE